MANTSLKFGNGNWAIKENSALAYSDQYDNFKPLPFDFSRTSSGTIVNKEGLIETVGNGLPRIDFSDSADGALLLEPQRTNLATYSEDFSQSAWIKNSTGTGTNPTLDFGYTSPDGSLNATKITFNVGTGSSASDLSLFKTTISAINGVATIYLKGDTGGEDISFLAGNTRENIILTNSWKRYTLSNTSLSQLALRLRGDQNTNNSCTIYVFGAQIEQLSYATSYIPTQGSASTRIAETCNNSGSAQDFNSEEGVLYAEINQDNNFFNTISVSDGTTSNRVTLAYTSDNIRAIVMYGGVVGNIFTSNNTQGEFHKVCIRYNSSNFSLFINGALDSTISKGLFTSNLNTLQFAQGNGGNNFYGNVRSVAVFKEALTDEELAKITSTTQQEVFYEMRDKMLQINADYYEFGDYTTRLKKLF